MDDVLKLPQIMDVAAVRAVRDDLISRRGKPVTIDASAVERIGALGIELLISANRQWTEDERVLQMTGISDATKVAFTDLGLDAATIDARENIMEQGKR